MQQLGAEASNDGRVQWHSVTVTDKRGRARVVTMLSSLPVDGRGWDVLVRQWTSRRTSAQNRAYWRTVNNVSRWSGHSPREVHEFLIKEFMPEKAHLLKQADVEFFSGLSQREFTWLLDAVTAFIDCDLGMSELVDSILRSPPSLAGPDVQSGLGDEPSET